MTIEIYSFICYVAPPWPIRFRFNMWSLITYVWDCKTACFFIMYQHTIALMAKWICVGNECITYCYSYQNRYILNAMFISKNHICDYIRTTTCNVALCICSSVSCIVRSTSIKVTVFIVSFCTFVSKCSAVTFHLAFKITLNIISYVNIVRDTFQSLFTITISKSAITIEIFQ